MNSFWTEISGAILPGLVTLFGTVLTILIGKAASVAQERWGIEVDAGHREALHAALMSGIQAALLRGLTGGAAVEAAVSHAQSSVPGAIAKLAPSPGVLTSIAQAKLREAAALVAG